MSFLKQEVDGKTSNSRLQSMIAFIIAMVMIAADFIANTITVSNGGVYTSALDWNIVLMLLTFAGVTPPLKEISRSGKSKSPPGH